jgi:hypothetical protein
MNGNIDRPTVEMMPACKLAGDERHHSSPPLKPQPHERPAAPTKPSAGAIIIQR